MRYKLKNLRGEPSKKTLQPTNNPIPEKIILEINSNTNTNNIYRKTIIKQIII